MVSNGFGITTAPHINGTYDGVLPTEIHQDEHSGSLTRFRPARTEAVICLVGNKLVSTERGRDRRLG